MECTNSPKPPQLLAKTTTADSLVTAVTLRAASNCALLDLKMMSNSMFTFCLPDVQIIPPTHGHYPSVLRMEAGP